MDTVIIELPGSSTTGKPQLLNLGPGDAARFGRGTPGQPMDVPIENSGVSRSAGEIRATDDYWMVSNFSKNQTYVIENPEGGGEHIKIPPRRLLAPVPFEFARVVLPTMEGFTSFKVYSPQHAYADTPDMSAGGDPTMGTFPLDTTAKYFMVLVALCEPRLRDTSAVAIPSVGEIVERLESVDGGLSRSAVNYHIDYLATVKLRIKEWAGGDSSARLDWKREALVSMALRFNLVREEHLGLLPSRSLSRRVAAGLRPSLG